MAAQPSRRFRTRRARAEQAAESPIGSSAWPSKRAQTPALVRAPADGAAPSARRAGHVRLRAQVRRAPHRERQRAEAAVRRAEVRRAARARVARRRLRRRRPRRRRARAEVAKWRMIAAPRRAPCGPVASDGGASRRTRPRSGLHRRARAVPAASNAGASAAPTCAATSAGAREARGAQVGGRAQTGRAACVASHELKTRRRGRLARSGSQAAAASRGRARSARAARCRAAERRRGGGRKRVTSRQYAGLLRCAPAERREAKHDAQRGRPPFSEVAPTSAGGEGGAAGGARTPRSLRGENEISAQHGGWAAPPSAARSGASDLSRRAPLDPSAVAAARWASATPPNVTSPSPPAAVKSNARAPRRALKAARGLAVTPAALFSKPPSARSTYNTTRTSRSAAYDSRPGEPGGGGRGAEADASCAHRDPTPGPRRVRSEAHREEGVEARGLVGVQLEDRPLEDDGELANIVRPTGCTTRCTRVAWTNHRERRHGALVGQLARRQRRHADARHDGGGLAGGRAPPARRYQWSRRPAPHGVQRAGARAGQDRDVPPERRRPSVAFATRTKRSGGYQANKGDAGARQLRVEARSQSARRTLGGDSAFRNRAEARVGLAEKSSTGSNVGPGSYNPRGGDPRRGTIEERLTQLVSKSPNSPGFNTSQIRVTARARDRRAAPSARGPGTYESKPLISVAATERGGEGKETHAWQVADAARQRPRRHEARRRPRGSTSRSPATRLRSRARRRSRPAAMQAGTDSFMTTQKRPDLRRQLCRRAGRYSRAGRVHVQVGDRRQGAEEADALRRLRRRSGRSPKRRRRRRARRSYDPRYFVGKPGIKGGGGQAAFSRARRAAARRIGGRRAASTARPPPSGRRRTT